MTDHRKTKSQLIEEIEQLRAQLAEAEVLKESLAQVKHDLGERVKELGCLFGIARLVQNPENKLADILQGTVELIPPAWHYPELTCGRIILGDQQFITPNFEETQWNQSADILIDGEVGGAVEVYYLAEKPSLAEGPFLLEERELVDYIAERLGRIVERTRSQRALREREQWLDTTLRSIGDGVIATDAQGRVTLMNPVAETLTGWTESQAKGVPSQEVFHIINEFSREPVESPVQRVLREGIVVGLANHTLLVTKGGQERAIADSGAPILDDDENILGAVLVFRDVSHERQREARLRQLSQVFVDSVDPIIIEDLSGVVIDLNPQAEESYGWSREELVGQPVKTVVPPERHTQADEFLARCRRGETVRAVEGLRWNKDGEVISVLLTLSLLCDEEQQPAAVATIAQDISSLKQSQTELRQALESAEIANHAKSEFLANMSHELRTPLNAILGFVQLMERDPDFSAEQRQNLEIVARSGEHLLGLINDVLDMSRIEAGRLGFNESGFDLYQLIELLEGIFTVRAEQKGIQFYLEHPSQLPHYIRSDPRKLRQVLMNLLSNAVKFTHEGGVTLRVGVKEADTLAFEVEDSGVGIPEDDLKRVFEPFAQTTNGLKAAQGSGLGLTISQRFVEILGGELIIKSQIGVGSIFSFEIPYEQVDAASVEKPASRQQVIGLAPGQPVYRILIAEDRETSRLLLVKLLQSVGFQVRAVTNGKEALAAWREWQPDLIWMDMRMPVMDGYEATRRIKATPEGQETPILALTATAFDEDRQKVFVAGCDDYVRKPFRAAEIFDKMAEHLNLDYLYEEMPAAAPATLADVQEDEAHATLEKLPKEWVNELYHTSRRGRGNLALALIDQIEAEHPALAKRLAAWVREYRFDKILALLEPMLDAGGGS